VIRASVKKEGASLPRVTVKGNGKVQSENKIDRTFSSLSSIGCREESKKRGR